MKSITLSIGGPIEARCPKCRRNTNHILISMDEEGPVKVQCQNCQAQHRYQAPIAVKKPTAQRPAHDRDAEQKEWKLLRPGMNSEKAADYSMTDAYKVKTLINHPVFGLGLVQRVVGMQKVEVLFEAGKKTMRCK